MSKKKAWLRKPINDIQVSIVTDPLLIGPYKITERLKKQVRKIRNVIRNVFKPLPSYLKSEYRGHPAVTRSIVDGLKKNGINSNYNPRNIESLSQTVVVVSGISALKQMLKLKQQGYIKYLIAGPNMLNDPSAEKGILAAPEIDRFITHAPVCNLITRFLPALSLRCREWASGVDCSYWKPGVLEQRDQILIYNKQNVGATDSVQKYIAELLSRGYKVTVINYGSYLTEEYLNHLQNSLLMVGFSKSESQGIAWSEAWSCDVPTLIWKNEEPIYMGVKYEGSTAPYLTANTGKFFYDIDSFVELIEAWEKRILIFSPRKWCIENMSDEACASHLLSIIESI
jgi:hypothetical protein